MGWVILAAICVAGFAITFRYFERYHVPMLPAIAVNYAVAFGCGLLVAPPTRPADLQALGVPAALLGTLFVLIFSISGLSVQRAGVARTTIAGRMSLVLTILGTVLLFNEGIGVGTTLAIALAIAGLLLTALVPESRQEKRSWILPILLFLCSAMADIGVSAVQRTLATESGTRILPTLCFGASTAVSMLLLTAQQRWAELAQRRTWVGGAALGVVNYASLLFLVLALAQLKATVVFPLMNLLAILFATATSIALFKERLLPRQWWGIVLCVVSLLVILTSGT